MKGAKDKVICPDCKSVINSKDAAVGDILECEECGTEVEVLSIKPLKYRELIEAK